MTSLREYYIMLNAHDWHYAFSDDSRVIGEGIASMRRLKKIMEESAEHAILFYGFQEHHFSGRAFGTAKQPKPELKLYEAEANEKAEV